MSSTPDGPLHDYLAIPFPASATRAEDLRLLAVDVETTGLNARSDHVLSVGFVPVTGLEVDLAGARHYVIDAGVEVGQSATIHGLTDDALAAGVPMEEALTAVLDALRGRVLLAHFDWIETRFLSAASRRVFGRPMPCATVDTLQIADRLIRSAFTIQPIMGELRLWAARDRYGLPRYHAHEALTDALACAELYLAQVAELAQSGPVTLARLAP